MKPEVDVAFGASSTKIPGHAGVAALLEERFTPVRVSGSSGGAILAAAWAILGAEGAKRMIFEADFSRYAKFSWFGLIRLAFWGYLSDGKELLKAIENVTEDRTFSSSDLEFDLYITASNMTDGVLEIYSKHTHPDLKLSTAIYRSATMPGVFKPMDDGELKMRDGAIYRDLPIDIWSDYVRPRIGHVFINEWRPKTQPGSPWNGLLEHQLTLARGIDDNLDATVNAMLKRPNVHILHSAGQGLSNLHFSVNEEKKESLYNAGYQIALEASNDMLYDETIA
jgi:predicted acylesterase/phospholipase RssA